MKQTITIFAILIIGNLTYAQNPVFNQVYNTIDTLNTDNADFFADALEVENGYLAVGYHNAWLADTTQLVYKPTVYYLNYNGNVIQQYEFNLDDAPRSFGFKLLELEDNNYLMGGRYDNFKDDGSLEGSLDLFIKFNLNGEIDWWRKLGDTLGLGPYGSDSHGINSKLINSFNSGYLYGGRVVYEDESTSSNLRYVKIDTLGNIVWEHEIVTIHDEKCIDMVANTTDSTYTMLVAKMIEPQQGEYFTELVLVKIDEQGQILREDTVKSLTGIIAFIAFDSAITSMIIDENNNYIIAGFMEGPYVLQVNPNYEQIWEFTQSISENTPDVISDITSTLDGNFVYTASTSTSNVDSIATSVVCRTVKLDQLNGDTIWTRIITHYGLQNEAQSYPAKIKTTSDGGFLIAGYQLGFSSSGSDAWLVKTDEYGCIDTTGCWVPDPIIGIAEWQIQNFNFSISPNPATTLINIYNIETNSNYNYKIIDVNGKVFQNNKLSNSKIDISNLPTGLYILSIVNNQNQMSQQKFVVE